MPSERVRGLFGHASELGVVPIWRRSTPRFYHDQSETRTGDESRCDSRKCGTADRAIGGICGLQGRRGPQICSSILWAQRRPSGSGDMQTLTDRQQETLDWIKGYVGENGIPPTRSELAEGLGLRDASSVSGRLASLANQGWIELRPKIKRGIRLIERDNLPVVGPVAEVAAGTPILAETHIVDRLPAAIAGWFQPRPDYFLTVRGDSMNRTGLCDGDIVAIHRTTSAESGQVVVARFGDEVTLKRFVRIDNRYVELRPESHNPAHEVMRLDLAKYILDIDGVAVGALIGQIRDSQQQGSQGAKASAADVSSIRRRGGEE